MVKFFCFLLSSLWALHQAHSVFDFTNVTGAREININDVLGGFNHPLWCLIVLVVHDSVFPVKMIFIALIFNALKLITTWH